MGQIICGLDDINLLNKDVTLGSKVCSTPLSSSRYNEFHEGQVAKLDGDVMRATSSHFFKCLRTVLHSGI